ncbi:hypothetical protein [Chryseobacterium gregarium]|uniref:hypothetical protein n=1 Tax=Chryseobacterium gregarium TaxID=456299 RepID=UPI00041E8D4D|nr:hypothetical protein [Chryseobacterium gregarium]
MKTVFKYDSQVQQTLILLLAAAFFISIISGKDVFFILFAIMFFLLAAVQYTVNVMKFFSRDYIKTDSRKAYMFISTYVVVTFLSGIGSSALNIPGLENILGIMVISWLVVSPVLMIQSLLISYFDAKNREMADPGIKTYSDHTL